MNKLKALILFIFLLTVSYGFSQDAGSSNESENSAKEPTSKSDFRPFRIGVFGDFGTSWMTPKNDSYTKEGSRLVAGWGLLFDWNFTENYTFSSGFSFGGYGGKLSYDHKVDTLIGIMERKYKIKYLEIPLNLKLKTNQIGFFTYFFQIGLNNSFRLSATADDNFSVVGNEKDSYKKENEDIIKTTSPYRLSFNVGAGTEYQISKTFSAFAKIGYYNGLTNALHGVNTVDPNVKENAVLNKVSITAGFLF